MAGGERFRVARARARLTLKDIALACGVSSQAVHKWERGDAYPSSAKLMKFTAATDVSSEWLLCQDPLDFHSTDTAPQGRHAKYWVREAVAELREIGFLPTPTGGTNEKP